MDYRDPYIIVKPNQNTFEGRGESYQVPISPARETSSSYFAKELTQKSEVVSKKHK